MKKLSLLRTDIKKCMVEGKDDNHYHTDLETKAQTNKEARSSSRTTTTAGNLQQDVASPSRQPCCQSSPCLQGAPPILVAPPAPTALRCCAVGVLHVCSCTNLTAMLCALTGD